MSLFAYGCAKVGLPQPPSLESLFMQQYFLLILNIYHSSALCTKDELQKKKNSISILFIKFFHCFAVDHKVNKD